MTRSVSLKNSFWDRHRALQASSPRYKTGVIVLILVQGRGMPRTQNNHFVVQMECDDKTEEKLPKHIVPEKQIGSPLPCVACVQAKYHIKLTPTIYSPQQHLYTICNSCGSCAWLRSLIRFSRISRFPRMPGVSTTGTARRTSGWHLVLGEEVPRLFPGRFCC